MLSSIPPWAQILIPALISLALYVFRTKIRPYQSNAINQYELAKIHEHATVSIYFGMVIATPTGFEYFIAIIGQLAKIWFYVICFSFLICIALAKVYEKTIIETEENLPPKAVKLFETLVFVSLIAGYIKISEVIWVTPDNSALGRLQNETFSEIFALFITLVVWGAIGWTLVAMAILPPLKKMKPTTDG